MAQAECLICGVGARKEELKYKKFVVMGYWVTDWICKHCFELDGEEKEGNW